MHPIRDRNGPNVTALSAEVYDCPMLFALLKMVNGQAGEFVPTKSAREQQSQHCPVPLALHLLLVRSLPERLALLGGQPVDPPYSSCKVGAEEPAVCGLVCQPANGPQPKVDCTR